MRSASKSLLDLVAQAAGAAGIARAVLAARAALAAVAARATVAVLAAGLIVGLAAGLTGCSVDVEGATCRVVGAVDNCPSGQACGTDLKCSVKAAGCAPCDLAAPARCRDGDVKQCSTVGDPVCGSWVIVTDCVAGQTCKNSSANVATCACDRWTVIPGGSTQACTSPSIAGAITRALEFPAPAVTLGGASPAVYGNELVDAAPLIIPAGVTLIGDETAPMAAPLNRIIEVRGSAAAPNTLAAVVVEAGASVRGVTVRRFDAGAPGVGLLVNGGSPAGGNSLVSVRVDVGGTSVPFAVGLSVAGGNAVTSDVAMSDVHVQGATVAGLEVSRYAASHVLLVTGSTFDQNQVGVNLLRGDLTLANCAVSHSMAEGIRANSRGGSSLSMIGGQVFGGKTVGVVLEANNKVSLRGVEVCGNAGLSLSVLGTLRKVGGIYTLDSPPIDQAFQGNVVHGNGGDQFLFGAAATGAWNLSSSSCAAGVPNVVGGYESAVGVGVAAISASVDARNVAWKTVSPPSSTGGDFFTDAAGTVDARGSGTDFCPPVATAACPQ
jgi:hypothetical protein